MSRDSGYIDLQSPGRQYYPRRGGDHEDVEDIFYDCCFLEFEGESFKAWEGKFRWDWRDEYSWRERGRGGGDDVDLSTHSYI